MGFPTREYGLLPRQYTRRSKKEMGRSGVSGEDEKYKLQSNEGERKDPEFQKRLKEARKKKWEDPEFQKRKKEEMKKKWEDPEFRKRQKEAVIEARSKPVEQYNIDGELVGTYPSVREAERKTGIFFSGICNAIAGRQLTAGGYKWKYKEE